MRIAFVGVKRKYQEIVPEYRAVFNQHHLELPYYFAKYGRNYVTITTVDYNEISANFGDGSVECQREDNFKAEGRHFDVVIHWRKWFEDLYVPRAKNLLWTCDHSYSNDWKNDVRVALTTGKLRGVLCYTAWHHRNMELEVGGDKIFSGFAEGVNTDIYKPDTGKDPYQMLWCSDPGRGLSGAIELAIKLYSKNKRFKLNICYPDYSLVPQKINHPALIWHGNVPNGEKLWQLFGKCGILPYTSTFAEPYCRAVRQMQAAGGLVLYPPNMGTPSELIHNGSTGIVQPVSLWQESIISLVENGKWKEIGTKARDYAVANNWKFQAEQFNELVEKIR